jgi:hypothetical protein
MMELPPRTLENISPPDLTNYRYFESWQDRPLAQPPGFNLVNAWRLSEFSLIAYADMNFIDQQLAALKTAGYFIDLERGTEAEYLFARDANDLVVAFRGTEIDNFWGALSDWLSNLNMSLDRDRLGSDIHRGFTKALDKIWQGLESRIQECLKGNSNLRVWLTGHSLGGAHAILTAYRARVTRAFEVHAVYTYGSPMLGDESFVNAYGQLGLDQRTYRFRNHNDIITRVPPFEAYSHVGQLLYIDETGKLRSGIELPKERSLSLAAAIVTELADLVPSFLPVARSSRILSGTIADHAPTYYAMHLFNNL